jgi:hypothetical protein
MVPNSQSIQQHKLVKTASCIKESLQMQLAVVPCLLVSKLLETVGVALTTKKHLELISVL